MAMSTQSAAFSWNMWKLRPKLRLPVAAMIRSISLRVCALFRVAAARKPKPPARVVPITRLASATQPMAVCTIG
ncbi:hypothetical protein D3C81_1875180 [compost metagenome]